MRLGEARGVSYQGFQMPLRLLQLPLCQFNRRDLIAHAKIAWPDF